MDDPVNPEQIQLSERERLVADGENQRGQEMGDAGAAGDMLPPQPSGRGPQQARPSPQNGLDVPGQVPDQLQYFKSKIDKLKVDCHEPDSYQQAVYSLLKKELIFADKESRLSDEEATEVFKYIDKKDDNIKNDDFIKRDVLKSAFSQKDAGSLFAKVVKNQWKDAAGVVLSSMLEENKEKRTWNVHYNLLESQINDSSSGCTVYQLLATKRHEDLINHDVCRLLTYDKWNKLKYWCIGSFVWYLVITFFLTYVLVTLGMAQEVLTYDSPLDHSRLVFQVLSIVSMVACLLIELVQIYRSRKHYFKDVGNRLELSSAVLLLFATVSFGFAVERYQWYIFALGYLIWIGLVYKHGILVKKFYIQAAVFVQVIINDVGWFLMLFLTVNLAFSGSYYLILKGANDLYVDDNVTSTAGAIFFVGIRTLAEAQPVTEYTEDYSWLSVLLMVAILFVVCVLLANQSSIWVSVLLMVVFLFVVCVLLVNLLIAQLSKTLDNVGETMDRRYQMKLAYTLAWLEINLTCCSFDLTRCSKCCNASDDDGKMMREITFRDLRKRLYQPVSAFEKIYKKTKNMEQHQMHMRDVLLATRDTLSKTEQRIPLLESSLGEKVTDLKRVVVDSFQHDIAQALNDMQSFPLEAKELLNEMKEHMQKAIKGETIQFMGAPRDRSDAKPFSSPTSGEDIMLVGNISLEELERIVAKKRKENVIDETDARRRRSAHREDENWSELQEEWETKMKADSQEPQERILAFIEGCRLKNCNPATWLVQEESPLVGATEKGHYQAVKLLLDLLGTKQGHTGNKILALNKALIKGHDHTAAMLVKNISDTDPSRMVNCFCVSEDHPTIQEQGQPTVESQGQPTVESQGQLTVESQGQPTVESQGQPTVESQGQPTVESQGQLTVQAQGQPTVESQGQPTVESQGQPTVESQGQPTVESQGQPTVESQGQLTVESQGQLTVESQGQLTVQEQGQLTVQAQDLPTVPAEARPLVEAQGRPTTEIKLTEDYFEDNYLNFWLALLEAMEKEGKVSTTLFKQNILGAAPNGNEKTIFQFLADWGNTTVFSHRVMQFLVEKKWKAGWRNQFILDFVMYMFTLVCLTVAVCKSVTAADVTTYHGSDDTTRLVFEIFSMILLLYTIVKEGWELKREGFHSYWSDHFNKAECLSVLLLLVVTIPLRFAAPRAHWYTFALGYLLWVLTIFKYSTFNRECGTYAQSLWTIVTTDVLYFMALFAVVDLALSGVFFLVLRGDDNIHLNNETSNLGEVLFIGLRMLTDGQNSLNYYGSDGGYDSFMSVATIVVFLFVVIVLLANILIAQLSNTYTNVQEEARGAAWARKAKTIARLERATWWQCCPCAGLKGGEWQDEEKTDDFLTYFPLEKNITTKIDDNVVSLMKKLPAIETNVAGLKVQTDRCNKNLDKTKKRVVDDVNSLTSDLNVKVDTLTHNIKDIINIELEKIKDLIENECKEIKVKIDKYAVKEINRLKHQYAEKEESLMLEYNDRLEQMKHDLDEDKPQG